MNIANLSPKFLVPGLSAMVFALTFTTSHAGETGYWAKSRILVQTRAGLDDTQLQKILARHGGRSGRRMKNIQTHVVQLPADADERVAVELLLRNPHIKGLGCIARHWRNDRYFGQRHRRNPSRPAGQAGGGLEHL